jgi:phasin family protein
VSDFGDSRHARPANKVQAAAPFYKTGETSVITTEQIRALNKAAVDSAFSIATTQFAAIQKLSMLNTSTAKAVLDDSIANTKALLGSKDVQEYVALQSKLASPAIEKAVSYSKSVYAVAAETNSELSKVAEKHVAELNESFAALLDKASQGAPAGSDIAFSVIRSFLTVTNSTFDNMSKATQRAGEVANANIDTVMEGAKSVAARVPKSPQP